MPHNFKDCIRKTKLPLLKVTTTAISRKSDYTPATYYYMYKPLLVESVDFMVWAFNPGLQISAIMLWVHLSIWNYSVYWGGREKFILAMYSIGYKISCKIVRMTCIIIRDRLDTPAVGFQNANSFLRGRSGEAASGRVTIGLSLRRSDFI